MAAAWKEPTADDVTTFMTSVAISRVQADEDHIGNILSKVVERIRGVITGAHVSPVSDNPAEVPPEAVQHALVLTVATIVSARGATTDFLIKGNFAEMIKKAEAWIERVENHGSVTRPTNALTATDPELVRTGSDSDFADMTTD